MKIKQIKLASLNLPMRFPFVTALGQKKTSHNLKITVRLENDSAGFGEASESLAWPLDTQERMRRHLETVKKELIGKPVESFQKLSQKIWHRIGEHPTACAALECALLDAYVQHNGVSLWKFFGGKQKKVTTSFTISAWPAGEAGKIAQKMYALGFRRFKIKVTGKDPEEDLKRVLKVAETAPQARFIIDANQGFETDQAIRFIRVLNVLKLPVDLIEQPVLKENKEGLKKIESETRIPVAADESARSTEEAKNLIRKKTVSVINVKLAKSGPLGALEIIRCARKSGVKLMIGCMAESASGLKPSVHLACGTGAFQFVDLDSYLLVRSPKQNPGFSAKGPVLSVP